MMSKDERAIDLKQELMSAIKPLLDDKNYIYRDKIVADFNKLKRKDTIIPKDDDKNVADFINVMRDNYPNLQNHPKSQVLNKLYLRCAKHLENIAPSKIQSRDR